MVLYTGLIFNSLQLKPEEHVMPVLDKALAERIVTQLGGVAEDQKPLWGTMTPAQVRGHLMMVVRYTLGEGPEIPFKGNWKTKNIFKHLILNGIVEIPHNIKLPRQKDGQPAPVPEATLEELEEALTRYMEAHSTQADLPTRTHPFFGPLTPREWLRFHVAHFRHHLKQFDCW